MKVADYSAEDVRKVTQYLCLESLLYSTRHFFRKLQKKPFVVGEPHEVICEVLEKVLTGQITRLIINVPPRYGKTEIAVKNFIAHALSLNPKAKFIHLSYSDDLALNNSEEIRDIVTSAEYQDLFPQVQIKKDSKAKKKWYTTAGGGVYATAAGGQVTGFGAGSVENKEEIADLEEFIKDMTPGEGGVDILTKMLFSGAIVIDDAIKPDDADSDTLRERINNRFDSTIRSRVNSRKTPIIIIMQRLHPMDLAGYVQAQDPNEWTVVKLPAIKEIKNELGVTQYAALWPFKHTLEELYKLRKSNEIVFARQYMQQDRQTEGLLFPQEDLHYYNPADFDPVEHSDYGFTYVDPSDSGGDDMSAPNTALVGDKIYVHNVIYNTHSSEENISRIVDSIINFKINSAQVEGNGGWALFGKDIRTKVTESPPAGRGYTNCEIRIVKAKTNKHTRILEASSFIKNHMVFRSDWRDIPEYKRFMDNLMQYLRIQEGTSKNKHDDAPDSLTGVATFYRNTFAHVFNGS